MTVFVLVQLTIPRGITRSSDMPPEKAEAFISAQIGKPQKALDLDLYEACAALEAPDTEDLFLRTQNGENAWTQDNPPIMGAMLQRSSMAGDFAVDMENETVFFFSALGKFSLTEELARPIFEKAQKFYSEGRYRTNLLN